MAMAAAWVLLGLGLPAVGTAFILPGVTPRDYPPGSVVDVKVNSLRSVQTQMNLDFYALPFCRPESIEVDIDNLGEFMTGERLYNSVYEVFMLQNQACKLLCSRVVTPQGLTRVKQAIDENYHHHWLVDNLSPIADLHTDAAEVFSTVHGFPVGYADAAGSYYIFNHIGITLLYNEYTPGLFRVVGFRVAPMSVAHQLPEGTAYDPEKQTIEEAPMLATCPRDVKLDFGAIPAPQSLGENTRVFYSYDVVWEPSDVKWASRYDAYLTAEGGNLPDAVHWFSITNSLAVALALSAVVAVILVRALRRDISKIREEQFLEQSLTGGDDDQRRWRLVAKDIFRPPKTNKLLLCVIVGTGSQVLLSMFTTMAFAFIGFLSPQSRGSVLVGMLLLYALSGMLSGYASARLYKTFRGTKWRRCSLVVATLFPGATILIFAILEGLTVWSAAEAPKTPFIATLILLALWIFVFIPLCFAGSYLGYQKPSFEYPQATNRIARAIPEQPAILRPHIAYPLLGLLPFAACFIELFFIMSSVWMGQTYYVFGFLLMVTFLMLLMCAEGAIVLVYFSLCAEDYRWWWRSVVAPGSVGAYVFAYSIFYFQRLQVHTAVTYVLYFGYMFMACTVLAIAAGTTGFFACFWFTRFLYGAIKAD